jgi:hypothetical protein
VGEPCQTEENDYENTTLPAPVHMT